MDILITGGNSGIGEQAAILLAPKNRIFISYFKNDEKAKAVSQKILENNGVPILVKADISTKGGCEEVFKTVSNQTQKLDALVNCAGALVKRVKTPEFSWEDFNDVFSLNAYSVFMLTSLFIPLLEKGINPSITNITSAAIHSGSVGAPLYACAKGAVDVFTRGLSLELAPKIRVNSIAPGVVETPFHENITSSEVLENWAKSNPSLRNGNPEEIAHAIKFCIENTFLNGESINVNGGKRGL